MWKKCWTHNSTGLCGAKKIELNSKSYEPCAGTWKIRAKVTTIQERHSFPKRCTKKHRYTYFCSQKCCVIFWGGGVVKYHRKLPGEGINLLDLCSTVSFIQSHPPFCMWKSNEVIFRKLGIIFNLPVRTNFFLPFFTPDFPLKGGGLSMKQTVRNMWRTHGYFTENLENHISF